MTDLGQWLPLIAFAEAPSTTRVVQAILDGAIDYLTWPFGQAEVTAALRVAETSSQLGTLDICSTRLEVRDLLGELTRGIFVICVTTREHLLDHRAGELFEGEVLE